MSEGHRARKATEILGICSGQPRTIGPQLAHVSRQKQKAIIRAYRVNRTRSIGRLGLLWRWMSPRKRGKLCPLSGAPKRHCRTWTTASSTFSNQAFICARRLPRSQKTCPFILAGSRTARQDQGSTSHFQGPRPVVELDTRDERRRRREARSWLLPRVPSVSIREYARETASSELAEWTSEHVCCVARMIWGAVRATLRTV